MPTITNVSTPNDFALEWHDAFGNRVTIFVCKYQEAPWTVRKSTEFGSPDNVIWETLEGCQADCFSNAVGNAGAYAENAVARAEEMAASLEGQA